jgi:RpiB/LacA/LacB family sugar-phosphate isomerase
MKIAIAADHAGFELKEIIKEYLKKSGNEVTDFGTKTTEPVDYPDFAVPASRSVASGKSDRGILICGSGQGMAISANKIKGIRAALCNDLSSAKMSRLHNDSNVLAIGGRVLSRDTAVEIVKTWLETGFEGGRHQRRVDKMNSINES